MGFKYRVRTIGITLFTILALFQLGMHETGSEHLIVRLALTNYPKQMTQIHELNLDVAGVNLEDKTVDLVVDHQEAALIKKLGFNVIQTQSLVSKASPDSQYQNPAKVEAKLKDYAAQYPEISEVQSVGKSLEGRDIYAIRITGHIKQNDPSKPRIFFNGMHHAREVMSVEVPLDTIDTLLTGYGKDSRITHWVDANEIWVLPMFNVDGNNQVWNKDNMWRKNTRGGYGVDINRNYPYAWNSCRGSSDVKSAQDYHGPAAASEPETQVMMDLVAKIRPTFSISYHSYSEIVIYPFGCSGQRTATKEVVETIGAELASKIINDRHRGTYKPGTAPELLYSVDGGDIDWMYHEYQVIPYVIEVNSSMQGFQPKYTKWRDDTVSRVRPGWQLLLDKMDGSSIHGQVTDSSGKAVSKANLHIERTSKGNPFVQDYPAQDSGYFHVILPEGEYKIITTAPGFKSSTQSISVHSARAEIKLSMKP